MTAVPLGDLHDLAEGQMRAFEDVGEHGVVMCRVDGTLHAFIDNCSHADTPLSTGRLRGGFVTCPLHGARFDVRDGSHDGPPAFCGIDTYPVDAADETAVSIELG